uniref:Rhodanese domain-containing protein n=1 Tax=Glossina pallidipes TaxID=7398 RepID=A0A1A9ZLA4_GLOPL
MRKQVIYKKRTIIELAFRTFPRDSTMAEKSLRRNGAPISFSSSENMRIVEYKDIKKLLKHPEKVLIDVREPNELRETGQIPTSINVPLDIVAQVLHPDFDKTKFRSKYDRDKPNHDTEIVLYCQRGNRAQNAAEILQKLGYRNVKVYLGSWADWSKRKRIQ